MVKKPLLEQVCFYSTLAFAVYQLASDLVNFGPLPMQIKVFYAGNLIITVFILYWWARSKSSAIQVRTLWERALPVVASFFWPVVAPFIPPSAYNPQVIGFLIFAVGGSLAVWAIWELGDSFSVLIMAPRRVATGGPYRYVRHPVYLSEILMSLGQIIVFPSLLRTLLWLTFVGLLIIRAGYEEAYLKEHSANYSEYAKVTGMVFHRLFSKKK